MIPALLATSAVIFCLLSYASRAILRFIWDRGHDLSEGKRWQWRNFSEDLYFKLYLFSFPDHRITPQMVTEAQLFVEKMCHWVRTSWRWWWQGVISWTGFVHEIEHHKKLSFGGIAHYAASWLCQHKSPVTRKSCPISSLQMEARHLETRQYQ